VQVKSWLRRFSLFMFLVMMSSAIIPHALAGDDATGKGKKGSTTGGDDSTNDGNDAKAGDKTSKPGSDADTSKTGFDEGTYAQATALTYRSMQEAAAMIASKAALTITFKGSDGNLKTESTNTIVIFDQTTFAAIGEYRIVEPQTRLLNEGLCQAEKDSGLSGGNQLLGVDPIGVAGSAVDVIEKVLKLMQTETTFKGSAVNVTDAALITEVAARLKDRQVFYPGQYLLPAIESNKLDALLAKANRVCEISTQNSIEGDLVLQVIALGLIQTQAQKNYDTLSSALARVRAMVSEKSAPTTEEEKKKLADAQAEQALAGLKLPGKSVTAAQQRAATLKEYLDSSAAFLKIMQSTDSKGQTALARLATAQTLDNKVDKPTTQVLVLKWLSAGAVNKNRKNLFFLGSRNYFAGGATVLYEYFDFNQRLLASGTITSTARYVHDTDFEKNRFDGTVRCLDLARSVKTDDAPNACPAGSGTRK
jgi:hypothetical protein